jgi:hypothetical protein
MDAYTVTNSNGAFLGEFTLSEILRGFRSNQDIVPGVSWRKALIVTGTDESIPLYDFLSSVCPELFAELQDQPSAPEPDVEAEIAAIEIVPSNNIEAFRNLNFEWWPEDPESFDKVSVKDSGGNPMECFDFDQLKSLVARGILLPDQEISVFFATDWDDNGKERIATMYLPEYWRLTEVLAELQ